jgi:hypothetical protein
MARKVEAEDILKAIILDSDTPNAAKVRLAEKLADLKIQKVQTAHEARIQKMKTKPPKELTPAQKQDLERAKNEAAESGSVSLGQAAAQALEQYKKESQDGNGRKPDEQAGQERHDGEDAPIV